MPRAQSDSMVRDLEIIKKCNYTSPVARGSIKKTKSHYFCINKIVSRRFELGADQQNSTGHK
jgi:hypothetical protein